MNRPNVICHMTVSRDGIATGPFLETPEGLRASRVYYEIHRRFKAGAFACGRVTMEGSFTGGYVPDLSPSPGIRIPREDYIADRDTQFYCVAFDRRGRLGWKGPRIVDEDPGYGDAHIIEILTEKAPDAYLAYLRSIGVSYLFAGEDDMDIPYALEKLWMWFGIEHLLLEGGPDLNTSFLKADMIDSLSLVIAPLEAGETGKPLFDGDLSEHFSLTETRRLEGDILWQQYRSLAVKKADLDQVAAQMEMAEEGVAIYYHIRSGAFEYLSASSSMDLTPEQAQEIRTSPDYVRLLDFGDLKEREVMEAFAESVGSGVCSAMLMGALRSGGTEAFRQELGSLSLFRAYYDFRYSRLREMAAGWCRDHQIPFEEEDRD
ncbi:MAG: RibD family protein [Lachnospiraceae bacterium]|nr:RibD family protein [Lachnospiraceae bacterium]